MQAKCPLPRAADTQELEAGDMHPPKPHMRSDKQERKPVYGHTAGMTLSTQDRQKLLAHQTRLTGLLHARVRSFSRT